MKLYEGFSETGDVVRWVPPSPARGRPEGFWTDNGYDIEVKFQGKVLWFGSPDGLSMAFLSHNDQNGEPVYESFAQIYYKGIQEFEMKEEKKIWLDEWEVEEKKVSSSAVHYGYENYWPKTFRSTYQGYLKRLPTGQYMKRKAFEKFEEPMIPAIEEYQPPYRFGETPY